MTILATDKPISNHRLACVLLFHDQFFRPFTAATRPVISPLRVEIPALRWQAYRAPRDGTYRFFTSVDGVRELPTVPTPLEVAVTSIDGDYTNHETITVTLPLSISSPPSRTDFLIIKSLWPTRSFRVPAGETAVIGRIESAVLPSVKGLRVRIFVTPPPAPPPNTPFTFTDENGEFLYRLPKLPGPVTGGTTTMRIRVNDGGPIPVTPTTFPVSNGKVQYVKFTHP